MKEWDYTFENNAQVMSARACAAAQRILGEMHDASVAGFKDKIELVCNPPPARAVRVTAACKKGDLVFAPYTTTVNCTKGGENIPQTSLDLGVAFEHPDSHKDVTVYATAKMQPPEPNKPVFLVPFWLVGTTPDASKANMTMRAAQCPSDNTRCMPIMENHRALKVGETLLLFAKVGQRYPAISLLNQQADRRKRPRA